MTSESDSTVPDPSALHDPKEDVLTVEKIQISAHNNRVQHEEEVFEWREVIRGKLYRGSHYLMANLLPRFD